MSVTTHLFEIGCHQKSLLIWYSTSWRLRFNKRPKIINTAMKKTFSILYCNHFQKLSVLPGNRNFSKICTDIQPPKCQYVALFSAIKIMLLRRFEEKCFRNNLCKCKARPRTSIVSYSYSCCCTLAFAAYGSANTKAQGEDK